MSQQKVSKVSVSLIAFFPVVLSLVNFHVGCLSKGLPVVLRSTLSGKVTGSSSLSTVLTDPSSR